MENIKNCLIYKILREFKNLFVSFVDIIKCYLTRTAMVIKDHYWDKRLGIKTTAPFHFYNDPDLDKHITQYVPTPYDRLKQIMDYLNLQTSDVFIDLGCGQGRTIFFAAQQRLKKVIGIEINKELADIAKDNCKNLKTNNAPVEIINIDVTLFDPKDGNIFFMFNPFGAQTLLTVIENIKKSLLSYPRKIRIVYFGPEHRFVLDIQNWLFLETDINNGEVLVWRNK